MLKLEYRHIYRKILLSKAELEKWEIVIDSENDKKLFTLFFDAHLNQKKQKKKKSLESLVFIVYGRAAVDELLTKGFSRFSTNQNQPAKIKTKKKTQK